MSEVFARIATLGFEAEVEDTATASLRSTSGALMNSRFASLVAGGPDGWDIAGDQFYVDLDLGMENLPADARLAIGTVVVEVSEVPHTGCVKFSGRFGPDALRVVNSPVGRTLRLRGVNTRVVTSGEVQVGDAIRRV